MNYLGIVLRKCQHAMRNTKELLLEVLGLDAYFVFKLVVL